MDAFRKWLGTPRKLSEKIQERKISWLELFTDLAYVVMLHALITNYSEHRETTSIWVFLLFFFCSSSISGLTLSPSLPCMAITVRAPHY